jgi:hypothetical protein
MPPRNRTDVAEEANRIMESAREAGESALESVRKFIDTVNASFPDISQDGPRSKIIDSAFKMTEQLVETGIRAAERITEVASEMVARPPTTARRAATRVPVERVPAKKASAKRAS